MCRRRAQPEAAAAPAAKPLNQDDALWQVAKDLLRKAGQLSGPDLLDQLEGLTGSAAAGKRLLVRLRHSSEVKVVERRGYAALQLDRVRPQRIAAWGSSCRVNANPMQELPQAAVF